MFLAAYSSSDLILFLIEVGKGLYNMSSLFLDKLTAPITVLVFPFLDNPIFDFLGVSDMIENLTFLNYSLVDIFLGGGFWVLLGYMLFVWLVP